MQVVTMPEIDPEEECYKTLKIGGTVLNRGLFVKDPKTYGSYGSGSTTLDNQMENYLQNLYSPRCKIKYI
jgi:hypothetical protein